MVFCAPACLTFASGLETIDGEEYEITDDVVPTARPAVIITRWLALLPLAPMLVILLLDDQVLASHTVEPKLIRGLYIM